MLRRLACIDVDVLRSTLEVEKSTNSDIKIMNERII